MIGIADLVRRLSAAGAPAEAIAIAIEAVEAAIAPNEERKAKDRERKAAKRAELQGQSADVPQNVSGMSADIPNGQNQSTPLTTSSLLSDSQGIQKEEIKEEAQSSEPRARGTRLPDDWELGADNLKFAQGRGWRLAEIEIEAAKFRNYWTSKAGAGARKVNWDRTWQNWILNNKAGTQNGPASPNRFRGALDALNEHVRGLDERSEEGRPSPPRLLSHG